VTPIDPRERNYLPLLSDALDLIGTKWDDWGDECCPYCIDDPWHRERFTTPARSKTSPMVPKCECVCHRLRKELGREDAVWDYWRFPDDGREGTDG
jgi:hypothetical protein